MPLWEWMRGWERKRQRQRRVRRDKNVKNYENFGYEKETNDVCVKKKEREHFSLWIESTRKI